MLTLTIANLKMMARNRHTTLWSLIFPVMLVVVFGLFSNFGGGSPSLGVVDLAETPLSESLYERLSTIEFLTLDPETPMLINQIPSGPGTQDYLLVIPEGFSATEPTAPTLYFDSNNPERNQMVAAAISSIIVSTINLETPDDADSPPVLVATEIAVQSVSFFDIALLGLLSLGIMTSSIISVAVKISTYRGQSILKRMLVTPLAIWKYFAAEIAAHLLLALVQAAIILAVGVFVFGAQIHGNLAWIFVIVLLGSLVFLNLGFILSAWANTPSAASGMGNVIAMPMLFFAGAFFSTTSLPWILPYVAQALPLTPMLTALREVAI